MSNNNNNNNNNKAQPQQQQQQHYVYPVGTVVERVFHDPATGQARPYRGSITATARFSHDTSSVLYYHVLYDSDGDEEHLAADEMDQFVVVLSEKDKKDTMEEGEEENDTPPKKKKKKTSRHPKRRRKPSPAAGQRAATKRRVAQQQCDAIMADAPQQTSSESNDSNNNNTARPRSSRRCTTNSNSDDDDDDDEEEEQVVPRRRRRTSRRATAQYKDYSSQDDDNDDSMSEATLVDTSDDDDDDTDLLLSSSLAKNEDQPPRPTERTTAATAPQRRTNDTKTTTATTKQKKPMSESFKPKNEPSFPKLSLPAIRDRHAFYDPCGGTAAGADESLIHRCIRDQVDAIVGLLVRAAPHCVLGTACSGTDAPALAMGMVQEQLRQLCETTMPLRVEHVFSCEKEPFKQAYLERNFDSILYPDITQLVLPQEEEEEDSRRPDKSDTSSDAPHTRTHRIPQDVYGRAIPLPDINMFVAGTSCKNFSMMRSKWRIDIEDKGCSVPTLL